MSSTILDILTLTNRPNHKSSSTILYHHKQGLGQYLKGQMSGFAKFGFYMGIVELPMEIVNNYTDIGQSISCGYVY
jgi:hypothetical protein